MDDLITPVVKIYEQIEIELIYQIARFLRGNDAVGGTAEWYVKKLDNLGALNAAAVKLIARYSGKTEEEIKKMLNGAGFMNIDDGVMELSGLTEERIRQTPAFASVLDDSFKELKTSFRMVNKKAVESVRQSYMDVLNRAYVRTASGTQSYSQAIRAEMIEFARAGITGATYQQPSGRVIRYSLEAVARRDCLTAVHQAANRCSLGIADEANTGYVEVSAHLGARVSTTDPIANHAGWQGKVYKLEGFDATHDNFYTATGYGDILGLGGVNCRHRVYPFWLGISKPHDWGVDSEENNRVYALTQKQRAMERSIRDKKRELAAALGIDDKDAAKKIKEELEAKFDRIIQFCDENGLEREFDREMIAVEVM